SWSIDVALFWNAPAMAAAHATAQQTIAVWDDLHMTLPAAEGLRRCGSGAGHGCNRDEQGCWKRKREDVDMHRHSSQRRDERAAIMLRHKRSRRALQTARKIARARAGRSAVKISSTGQPKK